jgi:hypothetical protein
MLMGKKDRIKTMSQFSIVIWAIATSVMFGIVICYGYQAYNMPIELSQAQADISNGELTKLLSLALFGIASFMGFRALDKYLIYKLMYNQNRQNESP